MLETSDIGSACGSVGFPPTARMQGGGEQPGPPLKG